MILCKVVASATKDASCLSAHNKAKARMYDLEIIGVGLAMTGKDYATWTRGLGLVIRTKQTISAAGS